MAYLVVGVVDRFLSEELEVLGSNPIGLVEVVPGVQVAVDGEGLIAHLLQNVSPGKRH